LLFVVRENVFCGCVVVVPARPHTAWCSFLKKKVMCQHVLRVRMSGAVGTSSIYDSFLSKFYAYVTLLRMLLLYLLSTTKITLR
jgi:hypothetical protein